MADSTERPSSPNVEVEEMSVEPSSMTVEEMSVDSSSPPMTVDETSVQRNTSPMTVEEISVQACTVNLRRCDESSPKPGTSTTPDETWPQSDTSAMEDRSSSPQPSTSAMQVDASAQSIAHLMLDEFIPKPKSLTVMSSEVYLETIPNRGSETQITFVMRCAEWVKRKLIMLGPPFSQIAVRLRVIVNNQWFLVQLLREQSKDLEQLQTLSINSYKQVLIIKKTLKEFINDDLSPCCRSAIGFINLAIHEIDAFNHAIYREQGATSVCKKSQARSLQDEVLSLSRRYREDASALEQLSSRNAATECINDLETHRIRNGRYDRFFCSFRGLKHNMQKLRKRYYAEGLIPQIQVPLGLEAEDCLTYLRLDAGEEVQKEVEKIYEGRCFTFDRGVVDDYAQSYVDRNFRGEATYQDLYLTLQASIGELPQGKIVPEEGEERDHFKLRRMLLKEFRELTVQIISIGEPFTFLINSVFTILYKTLDVLSCIHLIKREAMRLGLDNPDLARENSRIERFEGYKAEVRSVVACLRKLVHEKILNIQDVLDELYLPVYGLHQQTVISTLKVNVHKLDCVNIGSIYRTEEYRKCSGSDLHAQCARLRTARLRDPYCREGDAHVEFHPKIQLFQRMLQEFLELTHRLQELKNDFKLQIAVLVASGSA